MLLRDYRLGKIMTSSITLLPLCKCFSLEKILHLVVVSFVKNSYYSHRRENERGQLEFLLPEDASPRGSIFESFQRSGVPESCAGK